MDRRSLQRIAVALALACLLGAWTVGRFAPLSLDEVAPSVQAAHYFATGRILNWLPQGVIDPRFASLAECSNVATQGTFIFWMALWQKLLGINFLRLRILFF